MMESSWERRSPHCHRGGPGGQRKMAPGRRDFSRCYPGLSNGLGRTIAVRDRAVAGAIVTTAEGWSSTLAASRRPRRAPRRRSVCVNPGRDGAGLRSSSRSIRGPGEVTAGVFHQAGFSSEVFHQTGVFQQSRQFCQNGRRHERVEGTKRDERTQLSGNAFRYRSAARTVLTKQTLRQEAQERRKNRFGNLSSGPCGFESRPVAGGQ